MSNKAEATANKVKRLTPQSYEEARELVRAFVSNADEAEDFIRLIIGIIGSEDETVAQNWLIDAAFNYTGCYLDALETYKRAIREGYSPDEGFSPYHFHVYGERGERAFVPALQRREQEPTSTKEFAGSYLIHSGAYKSTTDPLALADAIATVLNHPNVPGELYDAMVDKLVTMHGSKSGIDMDTDRDLLRVWIPKLIAAQSNKEVSEDAKG